MNDENIQCPPLSLRFKALLIDTAILGIVFLLAMFTVRALGLQNAQIESLVIAIIWISFEPCWVAFTGGSAGHHIMGLRVRRFLLDKRLPLLRCYLRFFSKAPLAAVSLVSVLVTEQRRGIHDFISRSVVVRV